MLQVFDAPAPHDDRTISFSVAGGSGAGAQAEREGEGGGEGGGLTMARGARESLAGRSRREVSRARLQQRPAEQGVDTPSLQVEGRHAKVEQMQQRTAVHMLGAGRSVEQIADVLVSSLERVQHRIAAQLVDPQMFRKKLDKASVFLLT